MKEKPQLYIYEYLDNAFQLQAVIDDYETCSFNHSLYEAGEFTVTINYNIPNAVKFGMGLFVRFGHDKWMFGEITSISDSIGEDGKGSQVRTITGYDARYLFKRRVISNTNSNGVWTMTGTAENVMRSLIYDQCGTGTVQKRRLPIINEIGENGKGGQITVSESFTNLYDVLVTAATQALLGWAVEFDGEDLNLVFYEGNDLAKSVFFSTDYDSLAEGTFSETSDAFANVCYVAGKGEGEERDVYECEVAEPEFLLVARKTPLRVESDGNLLVKTGEPIDGLKRYECYDNQSELTTEEEYQNEGNSMLAQYMDTVTIEGRGLVKCPFVFGEQYDIGDIITIRLNDNEKEVRILSVTESWEWGAYNIDFSFGKSQPDLSQQLRSVLNQISKASSKTDSTDSVKWYNLPNDTVMAKGDVTNKTIGFTGNVGSGTSFTLYLDDENTGAKMYHVYLKQVSGSGNLTFTTGKEGASNLAVSVGTKVILIYVDSDGNVYSA